MTLILKVTICIFFSRHVDGLVNQNYRLPSFVSDDGFGDDRSRTVKVAAAQSFELNCKAKGQPKPTIRQEYLHWVRFRFFCLTSLHHTSQV